MILFIQLFIEILTFQKYWHLSTYSSIDLTS